MIDFELRARHQVRVANGDAAGYAQAVQRETHAVLPVEIYSNPNIAGLFEAILLQTPPRIRLYAQLCGHAAGDDIEPTVDVGDFSSYCTG